MARSGIPQPVQAIVALGGLVCLGPLLGAIAAAVKLGSRGPILFRQERMGQGGRAFRMTKFRTMRTDMAGLAVTASGDPRVTPIGRLLRKTKLDELPELWNIVRGDMALVGPRPEVPRYVDLADPLWREVLSVRPGLTDPVTIALRDEEAVLAEVDGDRDVYYRRTLLRFKLLGQARYLRQRTWWSDVRVLVATAVAIVKPGASPTRDEIEATARAAADVAS